MKLLINSQSLLYKFYRGTYCHEGEFDGQIKGVLDVSIRDGAKIVPEHAQIVRGQRAHAAHLRSHIGTQVDPQRRNELEIGCAIERKEVVGPDPRSVGTPRAKKSRGPALDAGCSRCGRRSSTSTPSSCTPSTRRICISNKNKAKIAAILNATERIVIIGVGCTWHNWARAHVKFLKVVDFFNRFNSVESFADKVNKISIMTL